MKLTVVRDMCGATCTTGKLLIDGEPVCFTLEDVVRPDGAPKVYGETAIPYGTYAVVVNFSNRFQRDLPLLVGVPGFTGIRIHPGNTAADTHGCLLVGLERSPTSVSHSRIAFDLVYPAIRDAFQRGEKVTITYQTGV